MRKKTTNDAADFDGQWKVQATSGHSVYGLNDTLGFSASSGYESTLTVTPENGTPARLDLLLVGGDLACQEDSTVFKFSLHELQSGDRTVLFRHMSSNGTGGGGNTDPG